VERNRKRLTNTLEFTGFMRILAAARKSFLHSSPPGALCFPSSMPINTAIDDCCEFPVYLENLEKFGFFLKIFGDLLLHPPLQVKSLTVWLTSI
jgi:hypothetical protein